MTIPILTLREALQGATVSRDRARVDVMIARVRLGQRGVS